ncbi:MAG: membrane dipeptidase, partial [bacterium]|nr:membrane dipeptidase [bacterium]
EDPRGSIVFDAHVDTPSRMLREGISLGEHKPYHQVDIQRMRDGGINAAFFAVFTSATSNTPLEAVKKALEITDMIVEEVNRYPADLVLATSAEEILQAKRDNRIAILLSLEGGHLIDSSLAVLREFYRLGHRSMGLTHSAPTPWASSAESPGGPDGLSEFGRDVVREMNRLGMIVDLAHASDETFFHTIETSVAPIISSHTCCRAVADYPRNLSDEMLTALAKNGGVIDIGYYNGMLVNGYGQPRPDLSDLVERRAEIRKRFADDRDRRLSELWQIDTEEADRIGRVSFDSLLDHFEHAAKVAGVDPVGFGSDLDAARQLYPEAVDDIAETVNLTPGLKDRGFSDTDIAKILGGNNLRVLEEVERLAG